MCDNSERSYILIDKDSTSFKSWTEISKPESAKSSNEILKKQNNKFNKIFKGTYLENNLTPTFQSTKNNDNNSLKSFNINDDTSNINNNNNNNNNNGLCDVEYRNNENEHKIQPKNDNNDNNIGQHQSCTSDSSRIPFSWAEITKIHPKFANNNHNLPKIKEHCLKNNSIHKKKIKQQNKMFLQMATDSKNKLINKSSIKMKKKDYV